MTDYYKILEVNSSSTADEIKKSYRRLALKFHPDKNPNDRIAENNFKDIVEAYEILGDIELRKKYDQKTNQNIRSEKTGSGGKSITPTEILALFSDTRKRVVKLGGKQINEIALFKSLNDLLSDNIINFLLVHDESKINKQIMNEVLICCKYLPYDKAEKLIIKLVKIAGSDNNSISVLHKFGEKLKLWNTWDQYKGFALIAAIVLFFVIIFNTGDKTSGTISPYNTPNNGDLNSSFEKNNNITSTSEEIQSPEDILEEKKKQLILEGWEKRNIENGQLSSCYNFKPKKGKIDNYLDVYVGSGTDVSIKVMNIETSKCVRYIFINSGTSYRIRNIPQGNYFLKIAYGKDWFSKIEHGQCIGKFLRNSIYEKGEDIMDFNVKYTKKGYSIPSFKLNLDVISNSASNSFNSENISEDEFNQ